MHILNIHGFRGEPDNRIWTFLASRQFFGWEAESPDYPSGDPAGAFALLESRLLEFPPGPRLLVGTSWGGFFALALAIRHGHPALLINPALTPWDIPSLSDLQFPPRILEEARRIGQCFSAPGVDCSRILALLGARDGVLDPHATQAFLESRGARVLVDERFGHTFPDYSEQEEAIRRFLSEGRA